MKLLMLCASALAALALLVGCGDDEGGTTDTSTKSGTTTETKSGTTTETKSGSSGKTRDAAALQPALLQLSDFPAGWTGFSVDLQDAPTLDLSEQPATGCKAIDDLVAQGANVDIEPPVSASANFVGNRLAGPFAMHQVGNWSNDDDPKRALEAMDKAFGACPTLTIQGDEGGPPVTLTVSKPRIDKHGDQTVAYSAGIPEAQVFTTFITIRRGNVTSQFTWSAGGPVDEPMLNGYVKKMDDLLKNVD